MAAWLGCQLAARFGDYWHAAGDFSNYTRCGLRILGSPLRETYGRVSLSMCPRCRKAIG